ncbi:MAG: DUF4142 domain-containing protein [Pedobacter sp.]|nr:MAG: DUF4142 domain-containing protein [Pedobacter sp.]
MKTTKSFYLSILIAGSLAACQGTDKRSARLEDSSDLAKRADSVRRSDSLPTSSNHTNESKITGEGADFMKSAALASTMEIDLGKAALANSNNAKVKEFAAKMVADHTLAKSDLIKIAQESGIVLSNEYPADVMKHVDEMKKTKGTAFDKHYVDMMVKEHGKTIQLFKDASSLRDGVIKDYAAKTLPVLEQHHNQAAQLKAAGL